MTQRTSSKDQARREAAPPERGMPPAGPAARRERLIALAQGASLETPAHGADEVAGYGALVPPGTAVYVAWVPGTECGRILEVSVRLARLGLRPVPHIAARELGSEKEASASIERLRGEAGVEELLLIAGDRAAPRGPFADSAALLRTGLFARHGITRLGLAAYPEGHPKFDGARWLAVFREKQALAERQGMALSLVTQFGFDGAAMVEWLRTLRAQGVSTPVRIGMAGPARIATLLKYGVRCGVGNSLRFLAARPGQAAGLLAAHGPEAILHAAASAEPALGIAGVHFFAFGGFAQTAHWIARVAAGQFDLSADGRLRVSDR
jgi:methylenetetrahydrofolate reductase (NADPH)